MYQDVTRQLDQAVFDLGITYTIRRGIEFAALQLSPTRRLYWSVAPTYYRRRKRREYGDYSVPPDPFELLWIDPHRVERFSGRDEPLSHQLNDIGTVADGEWDRRPYPDADGILFGDRIDETLLYQSLSRRYVDGAAWEETELYAELCDRVSESNPLWQRSTSEAEVRARCNEVDELYERIVEAGYKTQESLRDRTRPSLTDDFGFHPLKYREIAVDIGRDGEFLLVDSKHRLILAQLLDLEEVPVVVLARHAKWMEYRDEMAAAETAVAHPDAPGNRRSDRIPAARP